MTTMRPLLRRVELNWIAFLLVGALCGGLVMFGVDALRQANHDVAPAPVPVANSAPVSGRSGGVLSADTATGWYLLHEFNPTAGTLPTTAAPAQQGTLGQPNSSVPTINSQRIVGPGEGLSSVSASNSANDSIPPIIDPTEGMSPKR